ncbi:response regulator [Paenibacillus sp. Dod16]|uniref:response regulator n=1 Tax=Paenibacillus sp. Dod16 TaxID=3416392 RepID=UPI003CE6BF08
MYKVIIVEDEMLVRIGLRNSVEWSKFNMQVAADLSDGQMAWDYCLNEGFPDLVITDIRMPKMDGMELISNIRKENRATRIVVLSCLEEFELVRRAMSLGVSNYILKLTMTEEEIENVLNGTRMELDAQGSTAYSQGKEQQLLPANMDLIMEKYIKDFLLYGIYSVEEFEQFAAQSGIRLSPVRMVVCTMELDRYFELKHKFRDEHGHLVKMTLLNILYEITNSFDRDPATYLDETHYLLLFSFDDLFSEQSIMQEIHMILSTIQDAIYTYFKGSVSFGVSGVQSGFGSLRKLYFESRRALEKKFITGPGQKHTNNDPLDLSKVLAQVEKIRDYPPLRNMLSPMKEKEYSDYITNFVNALLEGKKSVRIILYQFIQWINTNLYDDHQNEKMLLFNITETLDQCDTLPEMLEEISEYLSNVVEQSRTNLNMSGEISKAIQFIKQNYDQNISLQQVADHVNLSFGYLSNLFKKELQITFVEYLNCYRIERAKELLTRTHLKSYDIAVKVGFSPEYTYFSKVFKKITGLNPNEYRRQFLSGKRGVT